MHFLLRVQHRSSNKKGVCSAVYKVQVHNFGKKRSGRKSQASTPFSRPHCVRSVHFIVELGSTTITGISDDINFVIKTSQLNLNVRLPMKQEVLTPTACSEGNRVILFRL